jgi:hypothetical protein
MELLNARLAWCFLESLVLSSSELPKLVHAFRGIVFKIWILAMNPDFIFFVMNYSFMF